MNQTIEQARRMVATFGRIDPGGKCWHWIRSRHGSLWADHQQAIRDSNPGLMASTFKAMVTAWRDRDSHHQTSTLFD